ncbi:hypothetical protein EDD15DRAFT_1611934 [Pisolithus albus]|nr:hypothetical protein EDD15DRAFT_1611934 [Pisolithus albus]
MLACSVILVMLLKPVLISPHARVWSETENLNDQGIEDLNKSTSNAFRRSDVESAPQKKKKKDQQPPCKAGGDDTHKPHSFPLERPPRLQCVSARHHSPKVTCLLRVAHMN